MKELVTILDVVLRQLALMERSLVSSNKAVVYDDDTPHDTVELRACSHGGFEVIQETIIK